MYAKNWHIKHFNMHSITSLSHEKILLAKLECTHNSIKEAFRHSGFARIYMLLDKS